MEAPKPPPPPPPLPAKKWADKDLSLLKGCWQLGKETQSRMDGEICQVQAQTICFDENGGGQRQKSERCPSVGPLTCRAPIRATFGSDGQLHTTQPAVKCSPPKATWLAGPNNLTCRRVSDTVAICRDALNFEHEFRKKPGS